MKILIVGGTSSVAMALKQSFPPDWEVITAGRKNCDQHFDLKDSVDQMKLPEDLDTIIHSAAHFGGTSDSDILEAEDVNVMGTLKLCQAALRANVKHFVLISSIFANIKTPTEKLGIYAISKRHADELASFYCSSNSLPFTILRPSQIYGVQNSLSRHQPFFYHLIQKAEKGENVLIYGSRDPLRNYIFIDDLTTIITKVVKMKVEGTYSCAQPKDVSYVQIANSAFSAFGQGGKVEFLKDKPDIPDNIFDKEETLYKLLGYYPETSIEEGILKIAQSKGFGT